MSRPQRACAKNIDYSSFSFFDGTPAKAAGASVARSVAKPKTKTHTPKASPALKASATKKRRGTPTPDKSKATKRVKKAVHEDNDEESENKENRRRNTQRTPAKELSPSEIAAKALGDKINQALPCPSSIAKKTPGYATRAVSAKYNRLMERYQEIKEIRTTEPEQKYIQLKALMEKHRNASEQLIEQLNTGMKKLQDENALLKKHPSDPKRPETDETKEREQAHKREARLTSQLEQANQSISEKDQQIATLKEDIRKLREKAANIGATQEKAKEVTTGTLSGGLVDFYELITALRVQPLGNSKFLCTCTRFPFSFEVSMSSFEVEYTPIEPRGEWPECLREAIYFEKSEWPVFLTKVITALFRNRDNE